MGTLTRLCFLSSLVVVLLLSYHYHARLNALQGQVEALQSRLQALEMERQEMFDRVRGYDRSYREWYASEVEDEGR
jgi:hypothetical protein